MRVFKGCTYVFKGCTYSRDVRIQRMYVCIQGMYVFKECAYSRDVRIQRMYVFKGCAYLKIDEKEEAPYSIQTKEFNRGNIEFCVGLISREGTQ